MNKTLPAENFNSVLFRENGKNFEEFLLFRKAVVSLGWGRLVLFSSKISK